MQWEFHRNNRKPVEESVTILLRKGDVVSNILPPLAREMPYFLFACVGLAKEQCRWLSLGNALNPTRRKYTRKEKRCNDEGGGLLPSPHFVLTRTSFIAFGVLPFLKYSIR